MIRRIGALTFMLLCAGLLAAQEKSGNDNPFKFAFGFKEKGGFGASLKGDENHLFGGGPRHARFFVTTVDAHWDSAKSSPDQAVISVKPGIVFWGPNATFFYDVALTLDAAQRAGQFKTTSGEIENVNQTLGGVTVIWIPRFFAKLVEKDLPVIPKDAPVHECHFVGNCTPEQLKQEAEMLKEFQANKQRTVESPANVTLTYYKAVNESSAVAVLPEGIEADKIILRSSGDLGFGTGNKWRFLFDASLTKPTSGDDRDVQDKIDLAIGVRMNKFTPVLRYVNGKEGGFKYDRQVLLGLLWQLSGLQ